MNTSTVASSEWEITVQLPGTIAGLSCWGADCSLSGTTLTIANLSYNGVIAPNRGSVTFGVSFTSSSSTISFDGATIIANGFGSESQFQTVSGLTAAVAFQNQWQSGSSYVRQYNVTVINSSGQKVKAWRIEVSNWVNTTHAVETLWNASYASESARLLLSGQAALNSGSSVNFGVQLKVPTSGWTPVFAVKGRL